MRFAILHVDQSIELLLKERVRIGGVSIYKNAKETLSMWGAYDALEKLGVKIPEKPDLELLHEERNSVQHKYANPSAEDAAFYVEKALPFIKRFLKDEIKSDILDELPSDYIDLFGK